MTIELVNPAGPAPSATYTQVVVAAGTAMVVIGTLIGAARLARPEFLIEVDAIAVK